MKPVTRLPVLPPFGLVAVPSPSLAQSRVPDLMNTSIEDLMNIEITSASRKKERAVQLDPTTGDLHVEGASSPFVASTLIPRSAAISLVWRPQP
jgi:hypothetical protein